MSNNNYKPGNPEYDFWNDKNLYPSLRHDDDYTPQPKQSSTPEDVKIGPGSIFTIIFIWLFFFAPFALFLTWDNLITKIIFWGGIVLIVLFFALWVYEIFDDYKNK